MKTLPPSADPSWSHYPETVLHFHGRHSLTVDLRSPLSATVRERLTTLEISSRFAVVTASNPYGIDAGEQENGRRHAALHEELENAGILYTPVAGASPDGAHWEEGFAVWMPRDRSRDLAARYEQTAFFWFDGQEFWSFRPPSISQPFDCQPPEVASGIVAQVCNFSRPC